jgi:hypothetical protein
MTTKNKEIRLMEGARVVFSDAILGSSIFQFIDFGSKVVHPLTTFKVRCLGRQ